LKKDTQILLKQSSYSIGDLYDKYAGMLLGYIYDVVKDNKLAEDHLVAIYSGLPTNYFEIIPAGENPWNHLQRIAKKHLLNFNTHVKAESHPPKIDLATYNNRNKFLKLMTSEQKDVFCGIYHYGKSISQLAVELNKTEDFVRKTLKEAFVIIRNAS